MKKYTRPEFETLKFDIEENVMSGNGYNDGDQGDNPWEDMFDNASQTEGAANGIKFNI